MDLKAKKLRGWDAELVVYTRFGKDGQLEGLQNLMDLEPLGPGMSWGVPRLSTLLS